MSIVAENRETCLKVTDLKMYFPVKSGIFSKARSLKAVDGVSFSIAQGETMGLVGESGCGKTTVGRTILKLYEATGGSIVYKGTDITGFDDQEMRPYRRKMQMIFQDPYTSLDPRMNVEAIISEPIRALKLCSEGDRRDRVRELIQMVGLKADHLNRYPHEFSGGQRQRIGIARALAAEPEFIVCDEPISALDVSIQAQVVNMLEDLQAELGLTYLFIAHDLSMVRHISRKVGVMYLGSLVEFAETEELYTHTLHPYTQALMSAVPELDPAISKTKKVQMLKGDIPSPINTPPGCKFASRCPHATARCAEERPEFREVSPGHFAACHLI